MAILLFAASVMMPPYAGPAVRQDRWALYIGTPKDAGSCKRLPPQGGTIPRRAQAPPHAAPTHGAEPSFSACPRPSCAHGALFLRHVSSATLATGSTYLTHIQGRFSSPLLACLFSRCTSVLSPSREHGGRLIFEAKPVF